MELWRLLINKDSSGVLKNVPLKKIVSFLKENIDLDDEVWTLIEESVSTKDLTEDPETFNSSDSRIGILCDMFKSAWEENPDLSAGEIISRLDITYRTDDFELYRRLRDRRI